MRRTLFWIGAMLLIITVPVAVLWLYAGHAIRDIEEARDETRDYSRHYMLVSNDRSEQWQTIFAAAAAAAEESDVCIEWVGDQGSPVYTLKDCMKIATAAHPDGILLYQSPEEDLTDLVDAAAEAGIPVVTALRDVPGSRRVSFVGANSYRMGENYGTAALEALDGRSGTVLVLMSSPLDDGSMGILYSQLVKTVESGKDRDQKIEFETQEIDTSTNFVAEEEIRDIFLHRQELPEVLLCLDSVSTECAYQAMVDFNVVSDVSVIGYYVSETVRQAMNKGLIYATLTIDAGKVGRLCIDALNEYCDTGHVSDYINVGVDMVQSGL